MSQIAKAKTAKLSKCPVNGISEEYGLTSVQSGP